MMFVGQFVGSFVKQEHQSWLYTIVSLGCLYPITLWLYNLFFHPLARFPGPLSWRVSRLPYMRAAWSGRFPHIVRDLHEKYGDIIRTAPNEISVCSPTGWDDVYSNHGGSKAFPKSEIWHGNPDGGPASVFVTPDLKQHARVRRFMDPAFSERAVLRQEPILHKYVDLCIEQLRERSPAQSGRLTVNIIDWINFTLLDIIGDLSFGESFDCLQKCEYEDWMDSMGGVVKLHYLSINLRHYPLITTLLKPLQALLIPRVIVKQLTDYHQRAADKLDRRIKSKLDRPDIVSQLLQSDRQQQGLSRGEVTVNAMLFINAASETTTTTLTGVFNHLVQNPSSLTLLEHEIRQFSSFLDLTLQALRQLPYLNAVLKEALRMCSPTPVGNMRITPPNGGTIDGIYVPGNTMVTMPQVALAFSERHFHDPYGWHPERWLAEAETDVKSPFHHDKRRAVRAFGVGHYNCVGEPLAWAQMRLLVAKLIWTFDVSKADTAHAQIAWEEQKVYAIVFKHPLDVAFTQRAAH